MLGSLAPAREIRVRLKREIKSMVVQGEALAITPPSAFLAVKLALGLGRARIRLEAPGAWRIDWLSRPRRTDHIFSERLWIRGHDLKLPESVPENLEMYARSATRFDALARVDLEDYVRGVLPAEMPLAWPLEALKAQAIAARSYAVSQAIEREPQEFDVEDTVEDQVYRFREPALPAAWESKLNRAVKETAGQVLLNSNREILKAFYSADCGCQSEDPKFVWGADEALTSVVDPSCQGRSDTVWKAKISRSEARRELIKAFKLPSRSDLKTIHVGGRTPSNRVATLIAAMEVDGRSRNIQMSAQHFRRLFGFTKIRSAAFGLHWSGHQLEIAGTGSGHGVGLCQRGAGRLAKLGRDYRQILKLFYPRASLRAKGNYL